MPIDTDIPIFACEFRNLPVTHLVAAPAVAAVRANSMMAREQANFLMKFCFREEGDAYAPIMVRMLLHRSTVNPDAAPSESPVESFAMEFQVPVMTLLPLNSLALKQIDVAMHLDLAVQQVAGDVDEEPCLIPDRTTPCQLTGRIRSAPTDASPSKRNQRPDNSAQVHVKIKAGQLPLPVGVTALLDVYAKAIHPVKAETASPP